MADLFYSADGEVMGGVLSRRRALRAMGLAALAAGSAGLLAACGGSAAVGTSSGSASASTSANTSSASAAPATSSSASPSSSAASSESASMSSSGSSSAAAASVGTSSSASAGTSASSSASATSSASASGTSSASASQAAAVNASGQFNGGWPYQVPPTGHWNAFVTNNIDVGIYDDLINPPFARYYWATNKWLNLLASDFSLQPPDKFVVTLRSGVKWSDGTDVTPKDVLTTFSIRRLLSSAVWSYLDSVTASGNTITFHMSKPASVVQRYVLTGYIYADSTFGQWAQKADALFNAGKKVDDPEVKSLITDFQKFRPSSLLANGPFKYDPNQITSAQLTLVKNPGGLMSDQMQFAKIVIYNGETPTITPLVLAKQVDYATHGFPPATIQAFQQQGIRILTPPTYGGMALAINYAKIKGADKEEVRQAIASVVDRKANGTFSLGESAKAQQYMTGMSDNFVPQWLEQGDISKLNQYPVDTGKATQLLQGVGWKKGADGIWVDDTGAKWDYDLLVQADYADYSAGGNNLAEQLTKFGLKTTVRAVEHVQANQSVAKGQFNLSTQGWGAGSPYPQFSYETDILANVPPEDVLGPGYGFNLQQTTKSEGQVNFADMVTASGQGLDQAAQKAAVTKIAIAFNEVLPIVPIYERYGNNPALDGVRVTGWPPDSDPIYKNSPYGDSFVTMMLYTGQLKPVAK